MKQNIYYYDFGKDCLWESLYILLLWPWQGLLIRKLILHRYCYVLSELHLLGAGGVIFLITSKYQNYYPLVPILPIVNTLIVKYKISKYQLRKYNANSKHQYNINTKCSKETKLLI